METKEADKNNGDGDQGKPRATIHERNGKYDVFVTVPVACLPDRKRPPTEVGGKAYGKHKKAKPNLVVAFFLKIRASSLSRIGA